MTTTHLKLLICLVAILTLLHGAALAGWDDVPEILSRIKAPEFPDRKYDITKYGTRGDRVTDCSEHSV